MINNDRIVQVAAIDLISLYATILKVAGTTLTVADATNPGAFEVAAAPASGSLIASEPVASLDIASGVSAVTIYFVPAYDYKGFTINGAAATMAGDDVEADGRTLYLATLSSGTITIAKKGV